MAESSAKKNDHYDDDFLFDKRLIERHIVRGLITRDALQKRLDACKDVAAQGENIDLDHLAAIATARRPAG